MNELKTLVEKLNPPCRRALEQAAELCVSQTHFNIEIEHFLIRLAERSDGDFTPIFRYFDIDPAVVIRQLTVGMEQFKRGNSRTPAMAPQILTLLREAFLIANLNWRTGQVRSGIILLAVLENEGLRSQVFETVPALLKLRRDILRESLAELVRDSAESGGSGAAGSAGSEVRDTVGAAAGGRSGPSNTPALDAYTIDLTGQARAGEIDPVTGRDAEIRQIIDILMRRRQNNPILTGEAGVGKTAVVEGFASRIVSGEVPPPLRAVTVRILDLGLLQAGAGVKGEFENRLKSVIAEVKASPTPVILFIDEAHTLIGAGGQAGQGDAANLLKPALARGELRTIAATTWAEYKKYFEKDPALARRFQVVKVAEPDEISAVLMVRGLVSKLERHHKVRIRDAAVVSAVGLSHRYIAARQLPDKAISVLDTACARVAVAQHSQPPALEAAREHSRRLVIERGILERESREGLDHRSRLETLAHEQARTEARIRDLERRWEQERQLVQEILALQQQAQTVAGPEVAAIQAETTRREETLTVIQGEEPMVPLCVDSAVIAGVVSGWTGIPLGRVLTDEITTILELEEQLGARVVGQPQALATIARHVRTYRANLAEPGKPTGVFLLTGPSGVGKTETALALADLLYGGERALVSLNMSEYQEAHTVSGLKGSPPGYVGYGTGGVLTEAVRRNPYCVVLLDEFEKAHADVQELFYQVFDKGILEDGEGVAVDFRNTLILLTSNIGADVLLQVAVDRSQALSAETLAQAIRPLLLHHFKAALLGRMVVVPYCPLSDPQIRAIVRLKLQKISDRFHSHYQARLTYDEALVLSIGERCRETDTGARAIDHILTDGLLPALSSTILERMARAEQIGAIHVRLDDTHGFAFLFAPDGEDPAGAAPRKEATPCP